MEVRDWKESDDAVGTNDNVISVNTKQRVAGFGHERERVREEQTSRGFGDGG